MLTFKEFLEESKIMENGVVYFLLPINIVKKKIVLTKNDKILATLQRELKVNEILDCINYFIDYCKRHDLSRFVLQTNRKENTDFMTKARIDYNRPDFIFKIFEIISKLTVKDFDKSSIDETNKSVAYIFKMRDFIKRLRLDKSKFNETDNLYIKFQFLYSITHENNSTQYNHVRSNKNFLILIEPRQMILNEISLHD